MAFICCCKSTARSNMVFLNRCTNSCCAVATCTKYRRIHSGSSHGLAKQNNVHPPPQRTAAIPNVLASSTWLGVSRSFLWNRHMHMLRLTSNSTAARIAPTLGLASATLPVPNSTQRRDRAWPRSHLSLSPFLRKSCRPARGWWEGISLGAAIRRHTQHTWPIKYNMSLVWGGSNRRWSCSKWKSLTDRRSCSSKATHKACSTLGVASTP